MAIFKLVLRLHYPEMLVGYTVETQDTMCTTQPIMSSKTYMYKGLGKKIKQLQVSIMNSQFRSSLKLLTVEFNYFKNHTKAWKQNETFLAKYNKSTAESELA